MERLLRHGTTGLIIAIATLAVESHGQTWTGLGANNLWSTAGNWSSPPGLTATTLTFSGATQTSSVNDAAVTSVGTITFTNNTAGSGTFVLGGTSAVSVTTGITTANGPVGADEIAFPITLGSALVSINVGGSGHFLRLSGVIDGGATNELRKVTDNGRLILTANNTFIGRAAFRVGEVQFPKWGNIGDPSPLGAGNLPIEVGQAGNTANMIYDGPGESTNRYIQVGQGPSGLGGSTITNNGSGGALVFNATARPSHPTYGNNLFNQQHTAATVNRNLTFQGSNAAANEVASVIVDNVANTARVGVTKAGSGRWILSGANTYTGGTQVNAGTLVLNGSTGIAAFTNQVAEGATLAGTGTLSGPTTVSGILSPGGTAGSIGTLSFSSSSFVWNSAGAAATATDWVFDLAAAGQSDRVSITGPFSKAGTGSGYRFDFGGSAELGSFTLVDWTTTTGFQASDFSYTNLGGGNTGSFDIQGTSLVFTAVPEPAALAGLAVTAAAVAALARRRVR
jgi:fibronectin-binding autotransporter adhesin